MDKLNDLRFSPGYHLTVSAWVVVGRSTLSRLYASALISLLVASVLFLPACSVASAADVPISEATQECLDCHAVFHPGIVKDWENSRHAGTTPAKALTVEKISSRISGTDIPEKLSSVAVGCAECHTLRNESHADRFNHNDTEIHVVVSPDDCATCHPVERKQYAKNIMAHARNNLAGNPLYQDLQRTILGKPAFKKGQLSFSPANDQTRADACFYCHGTQLKFTGLKTRETDAGEMDFPVIEGWPNQGVGRINLDGSKGSCAACHTRHQFSIEVARKPYTCKECHVGPDVPAFKVYMASKHGNLFSSVGHTWDFSAVPWTIGGDLTAPTCATCHISLLANTDGDVVNERTHQMSDRLGWRIFGLIYAHPSPKSPDTTPIRNKDGLPLPTDFDGGTAGEFLIGADEINERRKTMQQTCLTCHGTAWVTGYFSRLDNTIQQSNASIKTATDIIRDIWQQGYATGPAAGGSPFDESVERRWTDAWLLYANNVRFVSAMAGGGDYGVFEDGRYHLTTAIMDLESQLNLLDRMNKSTKPK